MKSFQKNWICVRTKPKHEHSSAIFLNKHLHIEIFSPRLIFTRSTQRGPVKVLEPLFPCYIFACCALGAELEEIRYSPGVTSVVQFADRIPCIPNEVIQNLRKHFPGDKPRFVEENLYPGDEVTVIDGALQGAHGKLLASPDSAQRVKVLLDFLGRSTVAVVERYKLSVEQPSMAHIPNELMRC